MKGVLLISAVLYLFSAAEGAPHCVKPQQPSKICNATLVDLYSKSSIDTIVKNLNFTCTVDKTELRDTFNMRVNFIGEDNVEHFVDFFAKSEKGTQMWIQLYCDGEKDQLNTKAHVNLPKFKNMIKITEVDCYAKFATYEQLLAAGENYNFIVWKPEIFTVA